MPLPIVPPVVPAVVHKACVAVQCIQLGLEQGGTVVGSVRQHSIAATGMHLADVRSPPVPAGHPAPPCMSTLTLQPTTPHTCCSCVSRHPNRPSMLLRRCGSLPALGITGTPRCTFQRSSTCGTGCELP